MRHYEIILLVKPDSDQVNDMIERYHQFIKSKSGVIHHTENMGRQTLVYPTHKLNKAYFVRMNIECDCAVQNELRSKFALNDAIMKYTIIRRDDSTIKPITFLQSKEPEVQRKHFSSYSERSEAAIITPTETAAQS